MAPSNGKAGSVAVVGLGIMGGAIARHLAGEGFAVHGYDQNEEARFAAVGNGVAAVQRFVDLPELAPVFLTSLPSVNAVMDFAADLAALAVSPVTIIEMSTLPLADKLEVARLLNAAGHTVLDCPISGTGEQMAVKDVVIYASGPPESVRRWADLLSAFSRRTIDLGEYGNGTRVKLIANLLVAIHNVATAEALGIGEAAGLDHSLLIDAISAGAGNSRMFELRAPIIADSRYQPAAMKLSVWAKDMAAISEFVSDLDRPSPLFDAVTPYYAAAIASGRGDLDTAAVALSLQDVSWSRAVR
jgi:putative dehydrogenase